jgi:hypothetical protein
MNEDRTTYAEFELLNPPKLPKKPKKPKPKAKKPKAKKVPTKREAIVKKLRKLVKKAAKKLPKRKPAKKSKAKRPVERTERLDMRITKVQKAKIGKKAARLKRTVTSIVLEALDKI